jgi:hypothetical protein
MREVARFRKTGENEKRCLSGAFPMFYTHDGNDDCLIVPS